MYVRLRMYVKHEDTCKSRRQKGGDKECVTETGREIF